ncbi:hypothetical protein A3Q56_02509 [Intoshia linei]|uniref:Protein kinase domain-containing protein n=1 Tax=Intoshia linei TaxID=1819745 RepID=A0A177B846_9BILA|nr:hypothetical protein A3Q56_02509 [Intoshia linei]
MATHSKISIDLLIKLLQFNPNKRISANEALNHPFVSRFRNSSDDKIIGRNVILPFNDNIQLSIDQYRQKLYEMIKLKKLQRRTKRTEQAILNSKSIYKKLISVGSNSYYKSNSLSSQKSCVNNMNDDCITSNGLKAIKSETFNDAQSVLHDSIRKKQKNSVEKPVEKIISPPKFYPRRNHLSPNITSLVNQKSKILRDTYNDKKKTSGRIISRWAFEPTCSWLPMINRNRNISNQSNHPTQNLKIDENCQYWQVKGQENTKSIRYSTYGKKQFDANNKDNLSRIGQRSILGGYSQLYSTLTASGLSAIQSRKI